ncbi:MAG: gliding motility protein GldL [Chitinophagales bacterium]|nr:gliding motility protein GldL [Bacteroidota bacterium]MCB9043559.1 gliding motility protein GldL [Chitinophagales bacterium]
MSNFTHSTTFVYAKNFLIGVGAAFIIIGALFKILHWPYANEILTYAMIGEASIFLMQAIFQPIDYRWERVYPELEGGEAISRASSGGLTQKLDQSLASAKIGDDLINSLGANLRTLGDNIGKLTSVADTAGATQEYAANAKAAAAALSDVKTAYSHAANIANDLTAATEGTRAYHEQVQLVSKNLAALNAVYELELQDTNNHLKAMNKFYGNLTGAINNLNESVEDTKVYKEQLSKLSKNLTSLNNVYGSMLSAMAQGIKG